MDSLSILKEANANVLDYSSEIDSEKNICETEDSIIFSDQNEVTNVLSNLNPSVVLKNIRLKNSNRLVLAHININSLRNKFDSLLQIVNNNIDILLISETKIDSSFPTAQFNITGYTTYRRDRNQNGGGIILYVKEDIPSKLLIIDSHFESIFLEINIRKKKWLISCCYNPNINSISASLDHIGNNIDKYFSTYENFIVLGDLNAEPSNQYIKDFCQVYCCRNILHEKTCFKNPQRPTCIDLIITNKPKSFQDSIAIETGLSDFHKMTLTVMKVFYKKRKSNLINYRSYKNFDNSTFMNDVKKNLTSNAPENFARNFDLFKHVVFDTFEKHAPLKKRSVRANQGPFMNKKISKEIMKRSRLKNNFMKSQKEIDRIAYNMQRNLCVSMIRREKKTIFLTSILVI